MSGKLLLVTILYLLGDSRSPTVYLYGRKWNPRRNRQYHETMEDERFKF